MPKPDLDRWLSEPSLRVAHRRESAADADRLWEAAQQIRVADVGLLGRLVRWRIPGVPPEMSFDQVFRSPPFIVLEDGGGPSLISGLVGRIWTLRRDYPKLREPNEYRSWDVSGTAQVLFANWVEPLPGDRSALCMEARVRGIGAKGRVGVAAVRPLVSRFQQLIATEGIQAAVKRAEGG
jgi:hypothetical protein